MTPATTDYWIHRLIIPLYNDYEGTNPLMQVKVADLLYQLQRTIQLDSSVFIASKETTLLLNTNLPLDDLSLEDIFRQWEYQSEFAIYSSKEAVAAHLECCTRIW